MKILAVIPARSGSKGIKNKNIVDLNGFPLIYYSIKEAFKINDFDRIFISTDDQKIRNIAESYGCNIPFLRPQKLAGDKIKTIDVVLDLLTTFKNKFNEEYDYVCLLQPTTPLRIKEDIVNCINIIKDKKKGAVVSLSKVDEPHPHKMKVIKNNNVFSLIKGTDSSIPRQDLPPVYELNGAVYLSDTKTLFKEKSFYHKNTYPYIMPMERSININNGIDLEIARLLFNKK